MLGGGQILGGGAAIKSVQVGTIALAGVASNTATITAVDLNNAIVLFLGAQLSAGGSGDAFGRLALTNATTVTATRGVTNGTLTVGYVVVEFQPGAIKSIQNVSISLAGVASNTQAVTSVDVTKAFLIPLGFSTTDNASGSGANWVGTLTLTSAVLVTAARVGTTGTNVYNALLVEYY